MSNPIQRRSFLAAGAISIPTIALAKGINLSAASALDSQFEDCMKQAGDHLKTMRGLMRDLNAPGARPDAIYYANQITILLAQCIEHAEQAHIPERSESKYNGDTAQFATDMRIKLTEAVSASNSLARQLLMGNDAEATSLYASLRTVRKEGHDEFEEEH
jgi:hypothetical protein